MELRIRQEMESDHFEVENVVKKAFEDMEFSDQTESDLVARLRKTDSFIPELSLVAQLGDKIVGHILLTKIFIDSGDENYPCLSLAPVSVLSAYQKRGIGAQLILKSHEIAKSLGYSSIMLVGHENYYPKFGYLLASKFSIRFPFKAPDINCMAIELMPGALKDKEGMLAFPKEFY